MDKPPLTLKRLYLELSDPHTQSVVDLIYSEIFTRPQPSLQRAVGSLLLCGTRFYGLFSDDRLVAAGSVMASDMYEGEAWVNELAVVPSERGNGFGKEMLRNLEDVAYKELDATYMMLSPRSKQGENVQAFYKHLGYEDHETMPEEVLIKYLSVAD